jgi:hypothetical protein
LERVPNCSLYLNGRDLQGLTVESHGNINREAS